MVRVSVQAIGSEGDDDVGPDPPDLFHQLPHDRGGGRLIQLAVLVPEEAHLSEPEDAARRMISKLEGDYFEITFPRRFAYGLKLLRMLPYWAYFPLVRRATGMR